MEAEGAPATKVGVLGAGGKMGHQVCRAVGAATDMELVAKVGSGDRLEDLEPADVAVDFTNPTATMEHLNWCIGHGIDVVAGTSGFTTQRLEQIRDWLAAAPDVAVLVVPNFSIGAVLMMRFAAEAARFYESAEIIELHHPTKADAPSGTARHTAELIAAARTAAGAGPMPDATTDAVDGARGATVSGVPVHSVRLSGLLAHQEVLLGGPGETLTLRHDSLDRASFMPGVLTAIRAVGQGPGLRVGLEQVLP